MCSLSLHPSGLEKRRDKRLLLLISFLLLPPSSSSSSSLSLAILSLSLFSTPLIDSASIPADDPPPRVRASIRCPRLPGRTSPRPHPIGSRTSPSSPHLILGLGGGGAPGSFSWFLIRWCFPIVTVSFFPSLCFFRVYFFFYLSLFPDSVHARAGRNQR